MVWGARPGRSDRASAPAGAALGIAQWVYDHEGQKRYPRAVYAWGNYPDAAKPERDTRATHQRHRAKKRLLSAVNSVFNLGRLSRGGYTRKRRDNDLHP